MVDIGPAGYLAWAAAFGFALAAFYEACRRFPLLPFVFFPLALVAQFMVVDLATSSWFYLAKVPTMHLSILLLTLLRVSRWGRSRVALSICFLLLPINILEAASSDLASGHWMNGVGGVLLAVASIPAGLRLVARDGQLIYPVGPLWMVAHTVWHWAWAYGYESAWLLAYGAARGAYLAYDIPIMLIPLLFHFLRPGTWLQCRAYTLLFFLVVLDLFPSIIALPGHWYRPGLHVALQVVSLALAVGALAHEAWRLRASGRAGAADLAHKPGGQAVR